MAPAWSAIADEPCDPPSGVQISSGENGGLNEGVTFNVSSGSPGLQFLEYRWQIQLNCDGLAWIDLQEGANTLGTSVSVLRAAGVHLDTLTITPAYSFVDIQQCRVRCIVSNNCGATNSPVLGLSVRTLRFFDPNPELLRGEPARSYPSKRAQPESSIQWDFDRMAASNNYVWGAACDGVTRVYVRWKVRGPGMATFSITDEEHNPQSVGQLARPGQTPTGTTVTDVPAVPAFGGWYVFAEYLAPADYRRSAEDEQHFNRIARFEASFVPDDGCDTYYNSEWLELIPPPVLLLHGYTGDAKSWAWSMQTDERMYVFAQNYHATSTKAFATNIHCARDGAQAAIQFLRHNHYAATQAAVVGHSMGGILSRLHAGNRNGDYFRTENLGQGDFYKLVTLYTPHLGSPWACFAEWLVSNGVVGPWLNGHLLAHFEVLNGAVHDLRPDGDEIQNLPAIGVPTHVIAGTGGADWLATHVHFDSPRLDLSLLVELIRRGFVDTTTSVLTGSTDHDLVVGSKSAMAGLTGSYTTTVPRIPANTLGIHTSGPEEDYVGSQIVRPLLYAPVGGPLFAPGIARNSNIATTSPCAALRARDGFTVADNGGIAILSPANGENVVAGQTLTVTVGATGAYAPTTVVVSTPAGASIGGSAPTTFTFTVPPDAAGTYVIRAMGIDDLSRFAFAAETSVFVVPSGTLVSIETRTPWVSIGRAGASFGLTVLGRLDNDALRDITGPELGTTYMSTDASIATVDQSGRIGAVSAGAATIQIANGLLRASVDVEVTGSACLADLNRDGLVDDADFVVFVRQYDVLDCSDASMDPGCTADLDASDTVDDADFVTFVKAYNELLCP